ncbi:MAG: hypothetical protein JXB32_04250, partial [Deltaproteobacteria bacterium]|nr:hypothetical protein [Deltaproteobacteria bacterium]
MRTAMRLPGSRPVWPAALLLASIPCGCGGGGGVADDDGGTDAPGEADVVPAEDAGETEEDAAPEEDDGDTAGDDGGGPEECYGDLEEGDLPERVIFRSKTTSFNRQWYVALHEGRIWVKPNVEAGEPDGEWRLLGTGLPSGGGLTRFDPPTEVVELSADGTWLHALSPAGVFYRGTDFTGDVHASLTWSDSWGHPAATGPGMTIEFPTTYGWSVSDSQGAGVHHYEDRLGTVHSVGLGVAHVYRIGPEGRTLFFNDWWLPADWSRQICLPDRGTFFAENLSVSASTIFVVGTLGELYTRLYDFDTGGENDTLVYSFLIAAAAGETRALPAEDWRRQPDVEDGLITGRITIFQDGQGNAARVLRVEGVRDGRTGFFHKRIFDDAWSFEETGYRVCGPFLNAPGRTPPPPVAPDDRALVGTLSVDRLLGEDVSVEIEIADFHIVCSPASARLLVDGAPVAVGGAPLVFPLHHVHALVLETRATEYWRDGTPAAIRAALLLPAAIAEIDDAAARAV